MTVDERIDRLSEVLESGSLQVDAIQDLITALVDDLALLVHHLVVLEHVLANLRVPLLDGGLCALDGLRHHLRFDRLVFW